MCVCGNEDLIVSNQKNPAVNLQDLVHGSGDVSHQMRKHCNRDNWIKNDSEGIEYIRSLAINGIIPPFVYPPVEVVLLVEGQRGMRVRIKKPEAVDFTDESKAAVLSRATSGIGCLKISSPCWRSWLSLPTNTSRSGRRPPTQTSCRPPPTHASVERTWTRRSSSSAAIAAVRS